MFVLAQMQDTPDGVRRVGGGFDVADAAFVTKKMADVEPQSPATQGSAHGLPRLDILGAQRAQIHI